VYQFAHQQMGARRLLGALAVVAMLGAACSSDDDDGAGDDGAVDTSVLGELDLAEGEPFKVGYAVDAGGEAVDTSENKVAGEATQEYINRHLGGIAGRPLDITFCDTRNSSATATECINQFVQGGMSAIFVSSSGNGETLASEAAEAGIPYVVYLGATAPELTNPNSFSLSGSAVSILGGPGIVMQQRELTKLGLLTIDVPTATQAVQLLATPAYRAAGLELELIPVPPGTADMSANVASALDSEMWLVLGDAAFCTTALDAIQTQAPDTPIFMAQACVSADSAADLPKGYEGVLTSGSIRLDPSDPEEDLFRAVLAEYSPGDLGGTAEGFLADAFATVLGFARMMEGYTGDGAPASVAEHLRGATALLPLGGGIEIACGQSPIAILTSLCSMGSWLTELDADGNQTSFERIDVTPFFAPEG